MSRTAIITGASGSMGAAAAESLASEGWRVIMACRNPEKAGRIRSGILSRHPSADIEIRHLDLASLCSVRKFVESMDGESIDVLFNNAGTICREWSMTEDGYERTFQVNFVGPALLSILLSDRLKRIVSMVSLTCSLTDISPDYSGDRKEEFSQLGTYARSKLSLLLFTLELGRRKNLDVKLSDPGIVNSNMIRMDRWFDPLADILFRPFCSSPEKGVRPALNAIRDECPGAEYYKGDKELSVKRRFISHPAVSNLYGSIEVLAEGHKKMNQNTIV